MPGSVPRPSLSMARRGQDDRRLPEGVPGSVPRPSLRVRMYPASRPAEGYEASQPEFAWLRARAEPPPRSLVWLGCWDCQQATPVRYAPSSAPLPAPDGSQVEGHFATFTLGYVAFQVFTVDYVAADQHRLPCGTPRTAIPGPGAARIWPPLLRQQKVSSPPQAFAAPDWDRLVTWDGALRTGTDGGLTERP